MSYSRLVARAVEVASIAHEGQYRKNLTQQIPYVSHSIMVGFILQRANYADDVVAAAMLHDVLEDTDYPRSLLASEFGPRIMNWLDCITEHDKSLPWEIRKQCYREQLIEAPTEALAIAVADKIHNLHSILAAMDEGEDIWAQFTRNRQQTLANLKSVLQIVESRMQGSLVAEYRKLVSLVAKSGCR